MFNLITRLRNSLTNFIKKIYKNRLAFISLCSFLLLIIVIIGFLFLVPSIFPTKTLKHSKNLKQTGVVADRVKGSQKEEDLNFKTIVLDDFIIPLKTGSASPNRFLKFDLHLVAKQNSDYKLLNIDVKELRKMVFQYLIAESFQNATFLQNSEELKGRLFTLISEQQKTLKIKALTIEKFAVL